MQCQEPEHFRIWPRPKKTRVFPQISAGSHSQGHCLRPGPLVTCLFCDLQLIVALPPHFQVKDRQESARAVRSCWLPNLHYEPRSIRGPFYKVPSCGTVHPSTKLHPSVQNFSISAQLRLKLCC